MVDLEVSLDTELSRAAWIITGYLLAYTVSMAFMGRLSDLVGRRRVYLVGLVIFIAGSVLAASAPTLNWLIGGRVVQALGAGALVPVSMALVGDLFPPERRAPALGLIGAVDTAGWMLGHLYGGVLMRLFDDWRLLFWINVPLGMLALIVTGWSLRRVPQPRVAATFDWPGALLITGTLVALNVGLAAGSELGVTDFYGERMGPPSYAVPLVLLALVLLGAFVWVERRARYPLLDLKLFRNRTVAAACLVNGLAGFALAIAIANVPLFINTRLVLLHPTDADILRIGAWQSGWVLSALTLTMALVAVPGGWLASRIGEWRPTVVGLGLALAGYILMSTWTADTGYPAMVMQLILAGLGLGLVIAPVATLVINQADLEQRGSAAALVIMLRLVGMTLGVATMVVWGVQRQNQLRLAGATDPLAVSDPAAFLLDVATQVISETFLFGALACFLGLVLSITTARGQDK